MYKQCRLLFLLVFMGPFLSCKKFLDITPRSVATEKAFYQTRQDALVAVNGAYNPLQTLYREVMWSIGEVMSDNTDDQNITIDNFTYVAYNPAIEEYWRVNYLGIARCNTVMDRIPPIDMNAELMKRLLAEVHFLRASYYFNLVRVFGKVPLVTREVTSLDVANPARATVDDVYALIIEDLKAAEELPVNHNNEDKGRATRGAAKALLAKVYLTQKNWQAAAEKAKEVIDLGIYQLLTNYGDNYKVTLENNAESIFEVQYVIGGQTATGNFLGNNFFELFAPAGSGSIVTGVPNSAPQGRNIPSADMVDAYEAGDIRAAISLRTSYTMPGTPPQPVNINYITKHLDPNATAGSLGAGSGNNWRVMRFSDVLLMYAEALNEISGGNAQAFEAINQVRRRASLPDLQGLSQAGLRDAIARERRVELAFEDHRWFDLLRTGTALNIMQQTKNMQERHLLLPVPQRERTLNANLDQNTGF